METNKLKNATPAALFSSRAPGAPASRRLRKRLFSKLVITHWRFACLLASFLLFIQQAFADPAYDDYVRANRYIENGQMKQAVAVLTRAITSDPKYLNAYIARGFALSRLGQLEAALAEYEKVLRISPQNAVALSDKGFCLYKLGRLDEALKCLDRAHALDPERPDILANRAEVHVKLGHFDQAIEDCNTAIKIDEWDADCYITRGDALLGKNKFKQALADYTKAISLNPDPVHMFHPEGESYYKRGLLYLTMHKVELAERDFQTSQTLGYKPPQNNKAAATNPGTSASEQAEQKKMTDQTPASAH